MGVVSMLSGLFSGHARGPQRRPPVRVSPEKARTEEAASEALTRAGKANDRAAMGMVFTTATAMKEESAAQAMLRRMMDQASHRDGGLDA